MTSAARQQRMSQWLFSLLLIYYWAMLFTQVTGEAGERGSVTYFFYVVPIALYVLASTFRILSHSMRIERPALLVLAFGAIVLVVSVLRVDVQTIFTVGLLFSTIFVILMQRVTASPNLLNGLFLTSIVVVSIAFAIGRSNYTILPNTAIADAVQYRISLFPQVAESALFSAIVLFVNILNPNARFRKIMIALSLYFLIFSGIRSAIAGSGLAIGFLTLRRLGFLRSPGAAIGYLIFSVVAFAILLLSPELLLILSEPDSQLSLFLYHSTVEEEEALTMLIFRTLLWQEHFRIAQQSPIFGIGTYDFTQLSDSLGQLSAGSESFLTNMYVRVGLPILILVAAFISAIRRGLKANGEISIVVGIILFVAMLAYGGFVAGYDLTFLAMMGLLAGRPQLEQS